jgi:hypothetical protein
MSLGFSNPTDLALVAYAEVLGDGTSTLANSGIATTRVSDGVYTLTLPSGLEQVDAAALVFVQGRGATPRMHTVEFVSNGVRTVRFSDGGGSAVDADFSVFIWKSTITPPALAPY